MMLKPNHTSAHRRNALSTRRRFGSFSYKIENRIVGKFQHNPVDESDMLVCSMTGSRSDEDLGGCRSADDLKDYISLSRERIFHRGVGRSHAVDDPYSLPLNTR